MWDFIDLDDIYIGYIGVIGNDWGYLKGMVWFSFRCRIGKEVDWLEFRECLKVMDEIENLVIVDSFYKELGICNMFLDL